MTRAVIRERLLRDERGFTLSEMMVTIMIMIVVLFALYSIFDMSLRVYAFGNNKTEAMESARAGMEKMEREIRGAYIYNSGASPSQNHLFFTTTSPTTALAVPPATVTQLTFGNDLGAGNGIIQCGTPCEYITYKLTDDASNVACTAANDPCTLRRVNTANSTAWGEPVVGDVAANGLTFTLLQSDAATLATSEGGAVGGAGRIDIVLVSLDIVVDEGTNTAGTQTLTTAIDLRNR